MVSHTSNLSNVQEKENFPRKFQGLIWSGDCRDINIYFITDSKNRGLWLFYICLMLWIELLDSVWPGTPELGSLTIAQARCGHCSDTNSIGNLRVGEQIGNNFAVPDWVWFLQAPTVKLKQMPKQSLLLILLLLPKYFYFLLDPMSS